MRALYSSLRTLTIQSFLIKFSPNQMQNSYETSKNFLFILNDILFSKCTSSKTEKEKKS